MNSISIKIQQGAKAFLMSEYKLLIIFMIVVAVVMAVALSPITALAFVTGGVLSAAAGYVGMHVATRANTRTAHAAEASVAKALNVSFKSGLTHGLVRRLVRVDGLVAVADRSRFQRDGGCHPLRAHR